MEQTQPLLSLNAFQPETNPLKAPTYYKPKRRIRFSFIKTLLFIVILFIGAIFAAVYVPQVQSYIPQDALPILHTILRSSPLPKTAEYVLFEAGKKLPSIQTTTVSSHIEIFDLGARGKNSLIIDGEGALDVSKPLFTQAVQDFKGVLKKTDVSESFDTKTRLLDGTFYFQTSHPDGLPRYADTSKWYSTKEVPHEISGVLAFVDHILDAPAQIQQYIETATIIGHEKERYIFEIKPTDQVILSNAKIYLWIHDKSWYVEQITLEGTLPVEETPTVHPWLKSLLSLTDTSELGIRFEITMKYINQPQRLVLPTDTNEY